MAIQALTLPPMTTKTFSYRDNHKMNSMSSRSEQITETSELWGEKEDKGSCRKCEVCLDFFEEETLEENKSGPMTAECDHLTEVCLPCLQESMTFTMSEGSYNLTCPICSQELEEWFIELCCTKTTFTTSCDLALQSHLRSDSHFFWCLAPNCGSGQIRDGNDPKMICGSCKASTCVQYRTPWRQGLTCTQFNLSSAKDEGSQNKIEKTTVACPKCHARIESSRGCLKIICRNRNSSHGARCGFKFCHSCLAPWGFFEPKHNPGCIRVR
ncbi:putative ring finger protein [Botrytis fragariae]|uniref:RBR-type E3 ubiquitin transferase n=1 Tax=Botrytis fragariae TaxID=1964551 RepID=A0A8H6B057_9HELO|nr:putative ring finger protein [Botrytis fragariae]KAF5876986.1 putative ring finger protein [Botrytis fragariae]